MLNQIKKMWKNQRGIILGMCAFAFIFHLIFTAMLATSEIRALADGMYQLIPPMFRSMAGFGESSNLLGSRLIAFGYSHPASLLMLMFIPISVLSRYITAELENHTVDILLTRYQPRYRLIITVMVFVVIGIVLLFSSMASGSFFGRWLFGLEKEVAIISILRLVGIGILFYLTISSIVLMLSVISKEKGRTVALASGLMLILYVLDAIARLWNKAAFLKKASLFNLYRPGDIVGGNYPFDIAIILLSAISVIFFCIALYIFRRRDL
jgi:ABC-2 type transport system permease protein